MMNVNNLQLGKLSSASYDLDPSNSNSAVASNPAPVPETTSFSTTKALSLKASGDSRSSLSFATGLTTTPFGTGLQASSTAKSGGKPVAAGSIAASNPQIRAAQRDTTLIANQPAVVLPFDPSVGLSEDRRRMLDQRAQALINKYSHQQVHVTDSSPQGSNGSMPGNIRALPELNYRDIGNIQSDIAGDRSLGEQDKAHVWTQIANHKLTLGLDNPDAWYVTSNEGARPEVIDSYRPADSPGHAFVGFTDPYHGPLAMLPTMADSREAIRKHEEGEFGGVARFFLGFNQGDYNASVGTIEALRAYRQGGFAAFAAAWKEKFVQP
jgi:hypothetical protein